MRRLSFATALMVLLFGSACRDRSAQEMQIRQLQESLDRAERVRLEEEARTRRDGLTRRYARAAGEEIMDKIGGGRDLIVTIPGQWYFDATTTELTIPMSVSFNGSFARSNNYRVSGELTVREDGSHPTFARADANENYLGAERRMIALGIMVGGALVLSEMSDDSSNAFSALSFENACGSDISVALRYQSRDSEWMTRGWWTVKSGETIGTGLSTVNRTVHFYATSAVEGLVWSGEGEEGARLGDVVQEAFTYKDGQSVSGIQRRAVSFFARDVGEGLPDHTQRFTCN